MKSNKAKKALEKSKSKSIVIPAKAGILKRECCQMNKIPAFAGMTDGKTPHVIPNLIWNLVFYREFELLRVFKSYNFRFQLGGWNDR
ncbi:MAG: hypothetical protein ABF242_09940 [Flavobacteriales bacterium]